MAISEHWIKKYVDLLVKSRRKTIETLRTYHYNKVQYYNDRNYSRLDKLITQQEEYYDQLKKKIEKRLKVIKKFDLDKQIKNIKKSEENSDEIMKIKKSWDYIKKKLKKHDPFEYLTKLINSNINQRMSIHFEGDFEPKWKIDESVFKKELDNEKKIIDDITNNNTFIKNFLDKNKKEIVVSGSMAGMLLISGLGAFGFCKTIAEELSGEGLAKLMAISMSGVAVAIMLKLTSEFVKNEK